MDLDYEKHVKFEALGVIIWHFWTGTHPSNAYHCVQLIDLDNMHICYLQELRRKSKWLKIK